MNSSTNLSYYEQRLPILLHYYREVSFWIAILVLIPGFFLDLIAAMIFLRKPFWKGSLNMAYFYSIHCVASSLACAIGIINFLPVSMGRDFTLDSVTACRTIWFLRLFFVTGSEYFNVQITLDRTIHVMYPKRFPWLSRPINHLKITIAIYILSGLFSCLQLFRYHTFVTPLNDTSTRPTACILSESLLTVYSFSFFILRNLGFMIIFVANLFIVRKLFNSKRTIMIRSQNDASPNTMSSREYAFVISLMSSNFIQLIMVLPFSIVLIIQLSYSMQPYQAPDYVAYTRALYAITNIPNYMYESLPFVINFLTNRLFRAELKSLLRISGVSFMDTIDTHNKT